MQSYTNQQRKSILRFVINIAIIICSLYFIKKIYDNDNKTEFIIEIEYSTVYLL